MSWDVFLLRVSSEVTTAEELEEENLLNLGAKSEVLSILTKIFPEANFSDPTWGILDAKGFSIEFNIGDDDPVDSIMLHVRGENGVIDAIRSICQSTGWRALDLTTGDFINFSLYPERGFNQWRAYRDKLFAYLGAEGQVDESI